MEDGLKDILKMAMKESYQFSVFAIGMQQVAEDLLDNVVIQETNEIGGGQKTSEEASKALSLVVA